MDTMHKRRHYRRDGHTANTQKHPERAIPGRGDHPAEYVGRPPSCV
jgi:hypothetical protein